MSALPRPGGGALSKSKPKADVTLSKDWHTSLSALLLKAEKAPDSLERMLAACRAVISFLVQILKPGSRHLDTPTVILGQHYLSQREMGEHHRGDPTRVYLQELCSYDPIEQPVNPKKYSAPGHTDIARWHVHFIPKARGRVRKEGLIGSGLPYIEVQLDGQGSLEFFRHAESYTFTLPSLILASPLSEECPIDFDGTLGVVCEATGLQADLRFRAWKEGYVKGEVTRLAGEGVQRIARLEGRWDMQVHVHSMQSEATGLLYDAAEMPPPLTLPAAINLAHPGPRISPRLWTAVLEALLYADQGETAAGGKKAAEMVAALPDHLKKALMYEVPQGPKSNRPREEDEQMQLAAKDHRPLPPAARLQRAQGRALQYQLQYLVQSITQPALDAEAFEAGPAAAQARERALRLGEGSS